LLLISNKFWIVGWGRSEGPSWRGRIRGVEVWGGPVQVD
jgi:hypothetical protein